MRSGANSTSSTNASSMARSKRCKKTGIAHQRWSSTSRRVSRSETDFIQRKIDMEKNWMIPRRTFLKGAGVALSLPVLNAMGKILPESSPEAAAATSFKKAVQAPVRMACIYFPNGVWEKNWFPTEAGENYKMPFALEPLERHRKEFLVFSGLDKKHSHQGDGHYEKTANYLTGLPVRKTPGKDINVGGISIDQLAAQQIGKPTPLPSLELGIDPVVSGIDSVVGYTRLYGCYISWRSPSTPIAKEIN